MLGNIGARRASRDAKGRRRAAAAIPEGEERVIVATGRYLGGFDDSRLHALFLTMPIAWKGTLAQYAGRLHRLNNAKREVIIYDYADMRVPVLARMAAKRRIGYQSMVTRYWVRAICFPAKWSHRAHPRKLRDNQAIK